MAASASAARVVDRGLPPTIRPVIAAAIVAAYQHRLYLWSDSAPADV